MDDQRQKAIEAAEIAIFGEPHSRSDTLRRGIDAYEAALWSDDLDAAKTIGGPVDLLIKWENGTKREPDATWERVAGENGDLYDWYLPGRGDYLSEFVNWRLVAWRLPPSFEGVEG